jgi:hypothetical protein
VLAQGGARDAEQLALLVVGEGVLVWHEAPAMIRPQGRRGGFSMPNRRPE